jgi:hypothetical protein
MSTLVLGLGLFFLGIQLIGLSLRQLAGDSFRMLVQRTTHSRLQASLVGLLFGAIMQSATAVTFILASLASSGLIETHAALPIVVWCNVGLTALAFVTPTEFPAERRSSGTSRKRSTTSSVRRPPWRIGPLPTRWRGCSSAPGSEATCSSACGSGSIPSTSRPGATGCTPSRS